jgi:sulfate permease, SulP family
MPLNLKFNRLELAGSLGDLGTLLPIAVGMILINGLDAMGVFFSIGLFYVLSGLYFNVTMPVQPMKVIGAYALATAMSAQQIMAAGILMGIFLLIIGLTNAITVISRYIPKPVVRGVQLSTGIILMAQGVRLMMGTSQFQQLQKAAEPYLAIQNIGPVPVGIVFGVIGGVLTLLFLNSKRFPAGLLVVAGGMLLGVLFGAGAGFKQAAVGLNWPGWLPFGLPSRIDLSFAVLVLVLPQIPMTIGNAVIANGDLAKDYFGPAAGKVTYRSLTISMALACIGAVLMGGMPLCHGAGGLAAHYRFGARTAGSNLIIGALFLAAAVLLGSHVLALANLMPMSILGILLLFAGSQLAMTVMELKERKEMFVALTVLGITLATNLAAGFLVGIVIAYILKPARFAV